MGNSETRCVFNSGNERLSGKLLEMPNLLSDFVPSEGEYENVLFSSTLIPAFAGPVREGKMAGGYNFLS
jgi:hypothetical protein